jgi:hypothetical protein
VLAQAHALVVDDAVLVWVVLDTNPHALSPKVKKFVQAQHWFQDLTTTGWNEASCRQSSIRGWARVALRRANHRAAPAPFGIVLPSTSPICIV